MSSLETSALGAWLKANPRGAGRYRPEGKCAKAVIEVEDDSSFEDVIGQEKYLYPGTTMGPEEGDYSDFDFYRLSLNLIAKDYPKLNDLDTTIWTPEGGTVEAGKLQHGDIVDLHNYRGCGAYVCYGPPEDFVLVKTGGEYGYCLPVEFCDAPEGYFDNAGDCAQMRAYPSPALLPASVPSNIRGVYAELQKRSGKKLPDDFSLLECTIEFSGTDSTDKVPKFSPTGDDGFFVFDLECAGVIFWVPDTSTASRYAAEVKLSDASFSSAKKRSLNDDGEGVVLRGKTIVFTGALSLKRTDATARATRAGARVVGAISASVDLVVAGPGAGSKLAEAAARGIRVISEEEFVAALDS